MEKKLEKKTPTISKHLVYTLSNNRRLHQSTCKSSTLDKLLCAVHCLKGLFEKATAPPQMENMSRYRTALCRIILELFSQLQF